MAELDARKRARLPDSAFAYVDAKGRRRLPINDASHVRNALARFDQTAFEDEAARDRARQRLLRAARRHGIVPVGFFAGQLRSERLQGEVDARAALARTLPRGAVTFLLSDIEGSTDLLHRLGERYAPVLAEVRRILRTAVRRAGGREVDARADEFFAAFERPAGALEAALVIERRLRERAWPERLRVRVRIGLHSGRPTLTDTGYVGLAVNAAARICAAGHGGQILVSEAAHRVIGDSHPDSIGFRHMGAYRLRGLPEPEVLYQVVGQGLPDDFPPLRTTPVTTA